MLIRCLILFCTLTTFGFSNLAELEQLLDRELQLINYRKCPWKELSVPLEKDPLYDVIILGDGFAAFSVATALYKEGISKFKILSSGPSVHLPKRTKRPTEPSPEIPALSFEAWFQAQGLLGDLTEQLWKEYLSWYSRVMKLPIESNCQAISLNLKDRHFEVTCMQGKVGLRLFTRRIVFANEKEIPHYPTILASKAFYYREDRWKWDQFLNHNPIPFYDQPELRAFADEIDWWKNHLHPEILAQNPEIGSYPYLGEHFEFKANKPGSASPIKRLYCFNEGSFVSQGTLVNELPGLTIGAERLAVGIAVDVFRETYHNLSHCSTN